MAEKRTAPESVRPSDRLIDLSVVVPCFNEELNIPELAERTLRMFDAGKLRGELLLVDDCSRDGTARVIREHEKADSRVVGVFHRVNRGMAGAWRTGVQAARGAHVAIIDADLQYQPEDVLRLYRTLMDSSVDVVQGFRSSVGRGRGLRYGLSRGFNSVLNGTFGMSLRDNKSGFICCAREVIQDLLTYKRTYAYWQSFIMVAAHAKGYSYKEIETVFEDRKQGQSFLEGRALRASMRCLIDVGTAFMEYRVHSEPHDLSRNFLERQGAELDEPPSRQKSASKFQSYVSTLHRTHGFSAGNAERYYETLNATQWLAPEQLRELQDEKLRRLIRHAYRVVPYYRVRMQELRLHPEDIRTHEDLHKLPFLTKNEVRRHLYFDIMQEGVSHGDLLKLLTSGNSGEPFMGFADRSALEFRWAAALRFREWTGYRLGDPIATFWNQGLGLPEGQAKKVQDDARHSQRLLLPAFELDDKKLSSSVRSLNKHKPTLIEGSAEVLEIVAEFLNGNGGLDFRPKAVISHGQALTAQSRTRIEESFGCQAFDQYRSTELAAIACESDARDGHLVCAEGYIVELLVDGRAARPGELGEIVVTDLTNFCMPWIRYRIGDLARAVDPAQKSTCGRGLPRVGEIQGTVSTRLRGAAGECVPGGFFSSLFSEYAFAVRRFSVIDLGPGALELRVVRAARYSDATLDEIKAKIRERLGTETRIEVVFEEPAPTADAASTALGSGPRTSLHAVRDG